MDVFIGYCNGNNEVDDCLLLRIEVRKQRSVLLNQTNIRTID